MGLRLEIVQYPLVGHTTINGSIIPKWKIKLGYKPEVELSLESQTANEMVHRFAPTSFEYVFVLLAVSLSSLTPVYLEPDWPPAAIGVSHLGKPGVKVLVSPDHSRAVAWVSDKGGSHELGKENRTYPFAEGMLRVVEVNDWG